MNIPSTQSGHWTDDELLATLYGVGPSAKHIDTCPQCQQRLASMQVNRQQKESHFAHTALDVSPEFLAAQRRAIYARMDKPQRWWNMVPMKRWAAGVATACVLFGSLIVYKNNRDEQARRDAISDAQLAQEVTMMAHDQDGGAMAPLEGLFE